MTRPLPLSRRTRRLVVNALAFEAGWLATCCGAAGGALSYYGGSVLAEVTLAPWLLPAEALAWGLICALLARQRP